MYACSHGTWTIPYAKCKLPDTHDAHNIQLMPRRLACIPRLRVTLSCSSCFHTSLHAWPENMPNNNDTHRHTQSHVAHFGGSIFFPLQCSSGRVCFCLIAHTKLAQSSSSPRCASRSITLTSGIRHSCSTCLCTRSVAVACFTEVLGTSK